MPKYSLFHNACNIQLKKQDTHAPLVQIAFSYGISVLPIACITGDSNINLSHMTFFIAQEAELQVLMPFWAGQVSNFRAKLVFLESPS
jgi:hypothetical protein